MEIDIYVPDGKPFDFAIKRVKHWAIVAHQDDAEIISGDYIINSIKSKSFGVIVVTDGSGSLPFKRGKKLNEREISKLRNREQKKAAKLGNYSVVVQLNLKSKLVKSSRSEKAIGETILSYLKQSKAKTILTHSLFDRHDTHRAISIIVHRHVKKMKVYGVEVWGSLDWLPTHFKEIIPISRPQMIEKLIACHRSQNSTGKEFDKALICRAKANATFGENSTQMKCKHILFAHQFDLKRLRDTVLKISSNFQGDIKSLVKALQ